MGNQDVNLPFSTTSSNQVAEHVLQKQSLRTGDDAVAPSDVLQNKSFCQHLGKAAALPEENVRGPMSQARSIIWSFNWSLVTWHAKNQQIKKIGSTTHYSDRTSGEIQLLGLLLAILWTNETEEIHIHFTGCIWISETINQIDDGISFHNSQLNLGLQDDLRGANWRWFEDKRRQIDDDFQIKRANMSWYNKFTFLSLNV